MHTLDRFRPAKRINQSPLAAAEKAALHWLANRTPSFIHSDHLTALGLLSMVGACASYAWARYEPAGLLLVVAFLALNWLGDSLDGTLARVRNRQRPRYGFYVDHVIDAIGATLLFGGLALSGYMSPGVAAALLVAYLMLSIHVYLATYTRGKFQLSLAGFGPTELRVVLAVGNLFLFFRGPWAELFGYRARLFDIGGVIATVCMSVVFVVAVIGSTVALYREEPLP